MELVILAAGMGSRFGGPKQVEPVNKSGDIIPGFSVYDAIEAGFDSVTFVIKEEHQEIFEQISQKFKDKIDVKFAFQDTKKFVPEKYADCGREKPWGTAHALLCAKDAVSSDFAMINADDFYGRDTFVKAAEFLKDNHNENTYGMVAFETQNTLSENGAVKRGVVEVKEGKLSSIVESNVEDVNGVIIAKPLDKKDGPSKIISPETLVSMNVFCFSKSFLGKLEQGFHEFLEESHNYGNIAKDEYLIPKLVNDYAKGGIANVEVLRSTAKWLGMTYKEDKQGVVDGIQSLVDEGVYPESLWEEVQQIPDDVEDCESEVIEQDAEILLEDNSFLKDDKKKYPEEPANNEEVQ